MPSSGLDRMLMCFQRDASTWLDEIKSKFDAKNQRFDEKFRQMFIQASSDQLNATYSKFILKSQLNRNTAAALAPTRAAAAHGLISIFRFD